MLATCSCVKANLEYTRQSTALNVAIELLALAMLATFVGLRSSFETIGGLTGLQLTFLISAFVTFGISWVYQLIQWGLWADENCDIPTSIVVVLGLVVSVFVGIWVYFG
jgi:hypothetical protein